MSTPGARKSTKTPPCLFENPSPTRKRQFIANIYWHIFQGKYIFETLRAELRREWQQPHHLLPYVSSVLTRSHNGLSTLST